MSRSLLLLLLLFVLPCVDGQAFDLTSVTPVYPNANDDVSSLDFAISGGTWTKNRVITIVSDASSVLATACDPGTIPAGKCKYTCVVNTVGTMLVTLADDTDVCSLNGAFNLVLTKSPRLGKNPNLASQKVTFTVKTDGAPDKTVFYTTTTSVPTFVSAVPDTELANAPLTTITVKFTPTLILAAANNDWIDVEVSQSTVFGATGTINTFTSGNCVFTNTKSSSGNIIRTTLATKTGSAACILQSNVTVTLIYNNSNLGKNPDAGIDVQFSVRTSAEDPSTARTGWTTKSSGALVVTSVVPSTVNANAALTQISFSFQPRIALTNTDFLQISFNPPSVLSVIPAPYSIPNTNCILTAQTPFQAGTVLFYTYDSSDSASCRIDTAAAVTVIIKPNTGTNIGTNPAGGTTVTYSAQSKEDTVTVNGTAWKTVAPAASPSPSGKGHIHHISSVAVLLALIFGILIQL